MSANAPRKRGRPPLLTHARILEASLELLREDPLQDFTMQRISQRLKVAPMTIYGYFESREDLLEQMTAAMFEELDLTDVHEAEGWDEAIHAWCYAVRDHLLALPQMMQLLVEPSRISSAWLEISEPLAEALLEADLSPSQVAFYTRWIGRAMIGALVVESTCDRAMFTLLAETPDAVIARLPGGTADRMLSLQPFIQEQTDDQHFEVLVKSLLAEIDHARTSANANSVAAQ